MRDKLRWLHRWIGIPLGVMFFITLATGALLGYKQVQMNFDDHGQTYRESTLAEHGAAIEFITAKYPITSTVVFPTEATPYYVARNRGDQALISLADENGEFTVIEDMHYAKGPVFGWFLNLHRDYLLGHGPDTVFSFEGSLITAIMALTAVTISLLGVYLWWPFRSKFNVKEAVPMSNRRRAYFNAHLTSGLIVVGAIVILGLSGATLYFRDTAQQIFGINKGAQIGVLAEAESLPRDWTNWLETATARMPDGTLHSMDFPRGPPPGGRPGRPGAEGGPQFGGAGGPPPQGAGAPGGPPGGFQRGGEAGPPNGGPPPGGRPGLEQAGPLGQAIAFRFVTGDDWLSVPGSRVYINQARSELVGVKRFSQSTFGQKMFEMLNPLHTGNNITTPYIVTMAILAALAAIMIFSGVLSMLMNLLRKKREKGAVVIVSKGASDKTATVTITASGA